MIDQNQPQKPDPDLLNKPHQRGDYYEIFDHLERPFSLKGSQTDGNTLKQVWSELLLNQETCFENLKFRNFLRVPNER